MMLGFDCALANTIPAATTLAIIKESPAITTLQKKRGKARIYSDRNYCNQRFALPSVGGFGNRLLGGNADKKCDDKIIEMLIRKSYAPNHCCHVAAVQVSMYCPNCGNALLVAVLFLKVILK